MCDATPAHKNTVIEDTDTKEFWMPIITAPSFQKWVKETYQVANGSILSDSDILKEYADAEE